MLSEQDDRLPDQRVVELLASLSYRAGELGPYLSHLACGVRDLLGLDWSVVTLCQNNIEQILASTVDLGPEADALYELHGTLTGTVVSQGCPLVVEDGAQTLDYGEVPKGYRAYLGVPLRIPTGKVIGTICSFQKTPRQFTTSEIKLVELFAERAATAIDNYQLYQQQQQTTEALQAEVAERREAEQALRESEERFRSLVENAADAFLVLDEAGRVVDVNHRACETLGYDREELLALTIQEIDVGYNPAEIAQFRQGLRLGQAFTLESLHRRKDGSVFPIEARIQLYPWRGRILELALVRDISDRRQAERDRERLAEIGELAAMIVHEVRNPLTTVLMGLNSFQKLDLPDRAQARLDLALEEADRLKRLLNEILLYARPQSLQTSELELNAYLSELADSLRTMPCAQDRRLVFKLGEEPVWVLADCDKLKQVLVNLVSNACEAIASADQVTCQIQLTPQPHPVGGADSEDEKVRDESHWSFDPSRFSAAPQVCLKVQNGGPPIPPDILPRLAQPFFTTKSTGNGLGLAIVRRIVEAHGGEFAIVSTAKTGTTVSVYLPQLVKSGNPTAISTAS